MTNQSSASQHHEPNKASRDGAGRVAASAARFLDCLNRTQDWNGVTTTKGVDAQLLRNWRRQARLIARSVTRPPAVGIFGESQVGKSFLVGSIAGTERGGAGLCIRDPVLTRTGKPAEGKPWTAAVKKEGGIPFLRYFNAELKSESTAVTCRFTLHPADEVLEEDSFSGRLISHLDLILALASGFMSEFVLDSDQDDLSRYLGEALRDIRSSPSEPRGTALDQLEHAWMVLRRTSGESYLDLLERAGFGAFVAGDVQPTGAAWYRLVGLLWGAGRVLELDRIYATLLGLLLNMGFPDIVEIPSDAVCGHNMQLALTSVLLLDSLYGDDPSIEVAFRCEGEPVNRRGKLTRPQLAALLTELILPVHFPDPKGSPILSTADLLDFPGARAPRRAKSEGETPTNVALTLALRALRRGKLTRLFSQLSEQREISALCLAASPGIKEASASIKSLLSDWIEIQRSGAGDGDRDQLATMFLVVTKADQLANAGSSPTYAHCPFGIALNEIRIAYSLGSSDTNWMEQWTRRGDPFRDTYWVHSQRAEHQIDKSDSEHLAKRRARYLSDAIVQRHVLDAEAKWNALLEDGGIRYLVTAVADRVQRLDKVGRLARELAGHEQELRRLLSALHFDDDDVRREAEARRVARRDVAALRRRVDDERQNALSRILAQLTLQPETVERVMDGLEERYGAVDDQGRVVQGTPDLLLDGISKEWVRTVHSTVLGQKPQTTGLDGDVYSSLTSNLVRVTDTSWMRRTVREAMQPFFDAPKDFLDYRKGIATAVALAWNRQMIDLGRAQASPHDFALPPSLSVSKPAWDWMLDHWGEVLPELYAENVGRGGPVPEGNDMLGEIMQELVEGKQREEENRDD